MSALQQTQPSAIDVVWLKKDVRLHDHAPLSLIAGSSRPCIILYLYEPDQLSEKTVHGSHVAFVNEGLVDLDLRLSGSLSETNDECGSHQFKCITVCKAGAAFTFRTLHRQRPIHRILAHMESSHLKSFARDKAVRRWCRANNVPIHEYDQTGVTRCLSNRDDFTTNFKKFLDRPIPENSTRTQLAGMRQRLVDLDKEGIQLHGRCLTPMNPMDIEEIPFEHRNDRAQRQYGGESEALDMFQSFLSRRGANYSSGISSPNTSWTTGSRLSPYLTWGHVSLRYVIVMTKKKQEALREAKKSNSAPNPWLRSLASFQSRVHWRSHFIQKLESQPSLEKQDQCLAFSHLRRQPNDFCQEYYDAWCQGRTGFPFVDACMRCLIDCGWLNFRMRAMLVSFATYNLWLDWKKIAGHLARVFLDYEPGIHYPQLQMQAGTTGINAMRVYNVTKQGIDQDPDGIFIRKYVAELRNVPNEYIHEPCNMPTKLQRKCKVLIGNVEEKARSSQLGFQPIKQTSDKHEDVDDSDNFYYPSPIVDEKATAKKAKDKLSAVRKQESTKAEAQQVYLKHGSRRSPNADRDGRKPKALSSTVKRVKIDKGQTSLMSSWKSQSPQKDKSETAVLNDKVVEEK
mmetsp:Transcript_37535/g.79145  ORF Transcript_37535/g.79145 Transcript_37535/m.79145 type:complete len:625 (+) Transcript_37535:258-2132(+)|eukprot:CAMPEP_0183747806 /NCGR_PEP_ID=MMETSP0737-20130205/67449_1 /TAXON_ID=385413 /ORGANISM="Thalassiosira miniscula, Strain CCMP1093" /LENGTH=624 /DNA_ID=CAMNT_0025983523 /DNA_START=164 /DNA_END=2038 /DNA_ORIENTATION=+